MKDSELILALNFDNINLIDVQKHLINNDWVIIPVLSKSGVTVTIYEDQNEYDFKQHMCKGNGSDYNNAFIECLKQIKDYYIRNLK